jgi:hypothetical protein
MIKTVVKVHNKNKYSNHLHMSYGMLLLHMLSMPAATEGLHFSSVKRNKRRCTSFTEHGSVVVKALC